MADEIPDETPSWLTEEPVQSKVSKSPESKLFNVNLVAREASTAATLQDGFTPAWVQKAQTSESLSQDLENDNRNAALDNGGPKPLEIDPELKKRMQFYHIIVRVLYMSAAILMGAAAGISLVSQKDIGAAFFAIYVLFFCLLICCFEVGLNMISRIIATNFGFMYTLTGRLIFLLFVGFMSFSLSVFGIIAMAWLYAVGLFHFVIMCKFPKFEEFVRQKDYFGQVK